MSIEYRMPTLLQQIMSWERDFSGEVEYLDTCTPVNSFPLRNRDFSKVVYDWQCC